MPKAIALHITDNVATLIDDTCAGTLVVVFGERQTEIQPLNDIPYGHKVALEPIVRGGTVLKYGQAIGVASTAIRAGEHVHIQNIESIRGRGDRAREAT